MPGQLFTQYFLTEGIRHTAAWHESVTGQQEFDAFRAALSDLLNKVAAYRNPNEAVTEQDLIRPLLHLLGWTDYLPQQGSDRNEDIPDHLLFADADSKSRAAAAKLATQRYPDALAVAESKRFRLPLDARDHDDRGRASSPHAQLLRYLATADISSDNRIRWGILTNGSIWRLYDRRARPRASGYHEIDLESLVHSQDEDGLRAFRLLFGRAAFSPQQGAQTSLLEDALAEGRRNEEQVAQDLSGVVFERVYPALIRALAGKSGAELEDVRQAALIFLYRLLFLLYAEDRDLLPVNDSRYDDYGLRKSVRDDIAQRTKDGDAFSDFASRYYDQISTLCRQIDKGDPSIGLPPYNGGLFAQQAAPLLERISLSDAVLAPIIYDLSHTESSTGRRFVNYRDMTVQQLGSIYERLLEREPARDAAGHIVVRPNSYARKDSGSFYTPQPLVDLIVERTLDPLLAERRAAFQTKADALQSDRRKKGGTPSAELRRLDPAQAALDLKILDPAMGSGHFLVTAVDYLSDAIAELVEYAPTAAPWLLDFYSSPLLERIAAIREDILARAHAANWVIDEAQLTDQAIIRRMVLKRCIYGVDKNPLTVELAKVSLWLHSFTVGAPLSFLDHHLRCGDSLVGLRVHDATRELARLGGLTSGSAVQAAENATQGMQRIEELSDADISEVEESAQLFSEVEKTTAPLRGLLDTFCGMHWLSAGLKKRERTALEQPLVGAIALGHEQAFPLLAHGPAGVDAADPIRQRSFWPAFTELWNSARLIAQREHFLHWQVAFPGVWRDWQDDNPAGGFDAIIGNPPWDRIKLQEVEWFATRSSKLALAPTAAARRRGIKQLRDQDDPLASEFDAAKLRADRLGQLIRGSGHYPLLGGGDINLYSLFVERAMRLVKPDGIVGLLTPSGIYADKTAARFFKSVSTGGRIGGLFDFENRRLGTELPPFFPDVDSRFKFCALIFGGEERRFAETECAFFLHDTAALHDQDRCFPLAPADFARVNPNTGTAPVFRTRRDADITRRIYDRHPVLVDRSSDEEVRAWPVRYVRMLDMANDSHRFRTAAQLDAAGFYPVDGNRWKKGEELYLPLYEGKMVQAFDHRAASIVSSEGNLFRPGQPDRTLDEEHRDPDFAPRPRYWVSLQDSEIAKSFDWLLAFKDITAPTNVRTMISAIVPRVGCGHTLPHFLPTEDDSECGSAACWLANLNSISFDYVARQKVQGTHLTWYIVEQLPVIAPADYDRAFGPTTARALVRDHVLRLTYTAHDIAPFARDLGHDGPPFIWNEEERRHLRAPPRRPLLSPLRPLPRRRRLHPRHLPHRPPPRRNRLRPLPHQGHDPRLLQRPSRRRHLHRRGRVSGSRPL